MHAVEWALTELELRYWQVSFISVRSWHYVLHNLDELFKLCICSSHVLYSDCLKRYLMHFLTYYVGTRYYFFNIVFTWRSGYFDRHNWPTPASPGNFNQKIVRTNLLTRLFKEKRANQQRMYFWHHRGFWNDLNFFRPRRCSPAKSQPISSSCHVVLSDA